MRQNATSAHLRIPTQICKRRSFRECTYLNGKNVNAGGCTLSEGRGIEGGGCGGSQQLGDEDAALPLEGDDAGGHADQIDVCIA